MIGIGTGTQISSESHPCRAVSSLFLSEATATFEGDSSGPTSSNKRWQHDLCGRPNTHNNTYDCLELRAPPADLPPVFGGLHELQIRGRREFFLRFTDLSPLAQPFHEASSPTCLSVPKIQCGRRWKAGV